MIFPNVANPNAFTIITSIALTKKQSKEGIELPRAGEDVEVEYFWPESNGQELEVKIWLGRVIVLAEELSTAHIYGCGRPTS